MKKMKIPCGLKSGPVRSLYTILLQVLLWGGIFTLLLAVMYVIDSRYGEIHNRMMQWRTPLLVWRMVLYAILITLWIWPGGLRSRYTDQVRASGHPHPRFAVFRTEVIPVLLVACSEYSNWTQLQ
ncbi:hypothetical protein DP590_07430 [Salmonella enterica]|nr:hypothetical protein [Salmonella enterica]ECE0739833.1 hypothetical protein [Salmonella enterica subsp. enterica serovar Hvittingfoss]HEC8061817.1 hypothetical protein [Salmonella enterica subsp. enterica serovar Potsdam]EGA8118261.1 hypothetical protein [Salmonella enterica]EHO8673540.1 hypothetical protein [Salmonella enterica]